MRLALAVARCVIAGVSFAGFASPAHAETLWHHQSCAVPLRMEIRIELDRKPLHRTIWPLCRVEREAAVYPPEQPRIVFDASRMRRRLGIAGRAPLEGNVWEAGMERSGTVLGVSLQDRKRIHLNTLLWMTVTKRERHDLGNGLVVVTTPLP